MNSDMIEKNKSVNTLTSLPNILTFMRILLIPIFIIVFYLPFSWAHFATAIIFAIACITDLLDGYLARKLQQISIFGAFLDPVADKLIVSASLLLLVGVRDLNYITLPAIIIVGREIVISALREWMSEIGNRTSMTVTYIGKLKTTLQMSAIFLLLAFNPSTSWLGVAGFIMLYLAAILTMWSMIMYISAAWPSLMLKSIEKQ